MALALVLLTAVVFRALFGVQLTCDDYMYRAQAERWGPWMALPGARARPLTTWAFVGMLRVLEPWGLAAVRLLQHALNGWLVTRVARRSLGVSAPASFFSAVMFVLWGTHAEVFWFSSIHDVTATSFVLAALWAAAQPGLVWVTPCALAAYACKEAAWCLPALLLCMGGTPGRRAWRQAAACAGMLVVMLIVRQFWVGSWRGELEPGILQHVHPGIGVRSGIKLLIRLFVPAVVSVTGEPYVAASYAAVPCLLFAWAMVSARAWRCRLAETLFGVGCALAPVCMLSVSLQTQENSRYLYLPTACLALATGVLVDALRERLPERQLGFAGACAAALGLAHAITLSHAGDNYQLASHMAQRYQRALEKLASRHPDVATFYLACIPDNVRGAFAARNVSEPVGSTLTPPRAMVPLALYDPEAAQERCLWRQQEGSLVLHTPGAAAALTHPGFHIGLTRIEAPPFVVQPAEVNRQWRTSTLKLRRAGPVSDRELLAVYNGNTFEVPAL